MSRSQTQTMQCMEVWGGNQPVDAGVAMAGLDAWVYCKPYLGAPAGGDVYYVSACATGRITRLMVADVSGHGSSVSELADALRSLMRRYVNFLDQTKLVRSLNTQFSTLSDSGLFATALVFTFFAPTNRLTICNAGHPPPVVYRAAKKHWQVLDRANSHSGNMPWGIDEVGTYDQFDIHLGPGDLMLSYTDSLIEARSPENDFLGQSGLLRILESQDVSNPAGLTAAVLNAIEAEGRFTDDDVTALVFRPNTTSFHQNLSERLKVPGRMIRAIAKSLRRGGPAIPWPDMNLANVGGAIFSPLNRFWSARTLAKKRLQNPDAGL